MSDQAGNITIIKKKKIIAGGHHGGAWKVAYADFVTAMMSLFIVLWLLSSSNEAVKKSVAGYFNDPRGTGKLEGTNGEVGDGHALPITRADMATLKERLLQSARQLPNFDKLRKQVEISASPDGLRIELMEDEGGTFFESGSAQPTPALQEFLTLISKELGKMPNRISIEGHTDSHPYSNTGGYSNWELSADRANAARRLMQSSGVGPAQIAQVRGFADQMPRKPDQPEDASNRRITVIVDAAPVLEVADAPVPAGEGGGEPGAEAKPAPESKPAAGTRAAPGTATAAKTTADARVTTDAKPTSSTAIVAADSPAGKPSAETKVAVATKSSPLRAVDAGKSFMTGLMAKVHPGAGKSAPRRHRGQGRQPAVHHGRQGDQGIAHNGIARNAHAPLSPDTSPVSAAASTGSRSSPPARESPAAPGRSQSRTSARSATPRRASRRPAKKTSGSPASAEASPWSPRPADRQTNPADPRCSSSGTVPPSPARRSHCPAHRPAHRPARRPVRRPARTRSET